VAAQKYNKMEDNKGETKQNNQTIKIGFLNCGCIRGKGREIKDLIQKENIMILGCCETWLRKEDYFQGDILVRQDDKEEEEMDSLNRRTRGKRGMVVLGDEGISRVKWAQVKVKSKEFVVIKILDEVCILFIYFPPTEVIEYLKKLEVVLKELNLHSLQKMVEIGDFNINAEIKQGKGKNFENLEEIMEIYGIFRIIYEEEEEGLYTYYHKHGGALIDQIWTNLENAKANIITNYSISDHELVTLNIKTENNTNKKCDKKKFRKIIGPSACQIENKGLVSMFNVELWKNMEKAVLIHKSCEEKYSWLIENLEKTAGKIFKANCMKHKRIKNLNLELPREVKYWLNVRQKMKKVVYKTKEFGELDRIRKIINLKIKDYKFTTWKKFMLDVNESSNGKILSMSSRIKRTNILKNQMRI
jgi:hypothetical protein